MYSALKQQRQQNQWINAGQSDETGRQSRTHLEELGVGDDDDEEDDRDNVGDGDDGDDDCGCDSDWQEAEVTLLPREETEVLRLL